MYNIPVNATLTTPPEAYNRTVKIEIESLILLAEITMIESSCGWHDWDFDLESLTLLDQGKATVIQYEDLDEDIQKLINETIKGEIG